jgi:single-strand DNA-binding protein
MSIEYAFHGFVAADAEAKVSQAGKNWTRLRVGVGKDEAIQWVSLAVFGKHAEAAAELRKGDKIYVEGTIKLDSWTGNDGTERTGLSVAAWKVERTHLIGKNKPGREGESRPDSRSTSEFYDDAVPF